MKLISSNYYGELDVMYSKRLSTSAVRWYACIDPNRHVIDQTEELVRTGREFRGCSRLYLRTA